MSRISGDRTVTANGNHRGLSQEWPGASVAGGRSVWGRVEEDEVGEVCETNCICALWATVGLSILFSDRSS